MNLQTSAPRATLLYQRFAIWILMDGFVNDLCQALVVWLQISEQNGAMRSFPCVIVENQHCSYRRYPEDNEMVNYLC